VAKTGTLSVPQAVKIGVTVPMRVIPSDVAVKKAAL
jgi:hypothetical protein